MIERKDDSVFTVYPAIDVLAGRVVRLAEGVRERVTVEGGEPADAARRFAAEGASFLHLVDLDGAFSGSPTPGLVDSVAAAGVPVQAGGGYRDVAAIDAALAAGAARVMVGTAALSPAFLAEAAARFGERLVVAIDVRDGRVAVEGWTRASDLSPAELAARCAEAGVRRLLVTSTRRDGSLAGPDLGLLEDVVPCGLPVIAAGGVASLDDLLALRDAGCEGAVAGSALWRGRFTLPEALAAVVS
ncbi:MAG: 1-(5-phosphoribosyl)-5-[(5-phosphoribosylamino)methylideneamino] imidazole-4-carboxamide isomerase [Actinobacteria bacterium]|nr:1-(5-phosphoribosyl)-5-[(5-phosphoribosylamino)methylideneamino] imidazole-4-carboxamide isomerase [Actinomycetota bacterium]